MDELIKDYVEQSELWSPDGAIVGLEAISSFTHMLLRFFQKVKQNWK